LTKRKLPQVIKDIRNFKLREINYSYEKVISHSQFSMFSTCPHKWALQYKEGKFIQEPSIHSVFGTSLHETIQHYLTSYYDESSHAANKIDLEQYFEERFRSVYTENYNSNKKQHFTSPAEMNEFYEDGLQILEFLKKKKGGYFSRKTYYLVGCEVPILVQPHPEYKNVYFKGYLDMVLYNETTNSYLIIDFKTSKSGWRDKEKKDEIKQSQLILYKKWFSQQYNIPEDKIEVAFYILRRKLWENSSFPIPRIQEFMPLSGKIKTSKSVKKLHEFIEQVFNKDGTYKDISFEPNPSKDNCRFCPFSKYKDFCPKGVSS
jgi:hypothetical protein